LISLVGQKQTFLPIADIISAMDFTTAPNDQPLALLKRLKRRSNFVRALRVLVPGIGLVLLLVLMLPVLWDSLLPNASFEGIRIDESRLVVDAPRAKGTMSDGGSYLFTAETASSEITNQDLVDLTELVGTFNFADGTITRATSENGTYQFSTELLALTSLINITSSQGDKGAIGNGIADIKKQQFSGKDGVDFTFADGTTLKAETMEYDAGRGKWVFGKATLVMEQN
jgi:lipopolysaccharide export system protein LptC